MLISQSTRIRKKGMYEFIISPLSHESLLRSIFNEDYKICYKGDL